MTTMMTIGGTTVDAANPCALNMALDREIGRLDGTRLPCPGEPLACTMVFVPGADGNIYTMQLAGALALSCDSVVVARQNRTAA